METNTKVHSNKNFCSSEIAINIYGKDELREGNKEIICAHILFALNQKFNCEFMLDFFNKINMISCAENSKLKNMLIKRRNVFLAVIPNIITNITTRNTMSYY